MRVSSSSVIFFFFNDTATTEIYTLSLHDALPISRISCGPPRTRATSSSPNSGTARSGCGSRSDGRAGRSEEHTSELQSRLHLVCRLLLEKKKEAPTAGLLLVPSQMIAFPSTITHT